MNELEDAVGFVKSSVKAQVGCAFGSLAVLAVVSLIVFRIFFLTFVDKHELGFTFDRFSGEIKPVDHAGWVLRNPIRYDVNTIDLRPYQVSISVNLQVSSRILNAKLVRFNPEGLDTFIAWHGRSAGGNTSQLTEILKCYAFDKTNGADCPFLTVISEISPDQAGIIVSQ